MNSAISIAKHLVEMGHRNDVTDLTPLKLMKLTYIAHGWMLGLCDDRPLFREDVQAWKYGPVILEMYKEITDYGRSRVPLLDNVASPKLDDDEKSIVEQTFDGYGKYTANQLIALTHKKGSPWYQVTGGVKYGRGVIIPNGVIGHYYRALAESD